MAIPNIKIDNVVEFYMLHSKDKWGDDDFPNVAPPFEEFSLEFILPEYIFVEGRKMKHPLAFSKWNAKYKTKYLKENDIYNHSIIPNEGWYLESDTSSNVGLSFKADIFCDKHGALTPIFNVQNKMISVKLGISAEFSPRIQEVADFFTSIIQPQMLALSFMHCKNVNKQEVDPNKDLPRRVIKHWQKKGKPMLEKYYTLNIEPMRKVLKNEGGSDTVGIVKALHICRGHFKNYKEGKGLFGKYHGLYWWESTLRGNKDEGEVRKEYNVKVDSSLSM